MVQKAKVGGGVTGAGPATSVLPDPSADKIHSFRENRGRGFRSSASYDHREAGAAIHAGD